MMLQSGSPGWSTEAWRKVDYLLAGSPLLLHRWHAYQRQWGLLPITISWQQARIEIKDGWSTAEVIDHCWSTLGIAEDQRQRNSWTQSQSQSITSSTHPFQQCHLYLLYLCSNLACLLPRISMTSSTQQTSPGSQLFTPLHLSMWHSRLIMNALHSILQRQRVWVQMLTLDSLPAFFLHWS